MSGAGFVFWGVFAAFGLFIGAYVAWMLVIEWRERGGRK